MHKLAFLLKTYSEDFLYAERLIETFNIFNVDILPLYIVVPEKDLSVFEVFGKKNIQVLKEEIFSQHLTDKIINGISSGYINQEIIKLCFWEMKLAENYLCLDSDGVFLKEFRQNDFFNERGIPYTYLTEDLDLATEPEYYKEHWEKRFNSILKIYKAIGYRNKQFLTCHGFSLFNSSVLADLKSNFMIPRCYSYLDLLLISPFEFSWYNIWLQHSQVIPVIQKEPIFKYIHNKNQHIDFMLKGITEKDLSRSFLGVVVNSNFSRHAGVLDFNIDRNFALDQYFTGKELLVILIKKVKRKLLRIKA